MRQELVRPFLSTFFTSLSRRVFYLALAFALTTRLLAAPHRDGEIISARPRAPLAAFESLDDFGHGYFPRAQYEEARTKKEFEFLDKL